MVDENIPNNITNYTFIENKTFTIKFMKFYFYKSKVSCEKSLGYNEN